MSEDIKRYTFEMVESKDGELVDVYAHQSAIDSLVEQNAKLVAKNDDLDKALSDQVYRDTMLSNMAIESGGINLSLEGGACQLLADSFAEQFRSSGATNYVEMSFGSNDPDIGDLVVTLQRKDGKTPGQIRSETDEINAKLVEALSEITEFYVSMINSGDCGNWNPEEDSEVIKSRSALALAKGAKA